MGEQFKLLQLLQQLHKLLQPAVPQAREGGGRGVRRHLF